MCVSLGRDVTAYCVQVGLVILVCICCVRVFMQHLVVGMVVCVDVLHVMGQLGNVAAVMWVATAQLGADRADCTRVSGGLGGSCHLSWVLALLVHVGGWEMSGCGKT